MADRWRVSSAATLSHGLCSLDGLAARDPRGSPCTQGALRSESLLHRLSSLREEIRGPGRTPLFNVLYWHGALGRYVNDGKKYIVKYDPLDISRVYLLEADQAYLEIPYRDLSYEGVSLDEVKKGARALRAAGQPVENQEKLFQAVMKQRELIENAKSKTITARRRSQLRKNAKQETSVKPSPSSVSAPEPDGPADPFPFEIWHD
jgi:putative transposase